MYLCSYSRYHGSRYAFSLCFQHQALGNRISWEVETPQQNTARHQKILGTWGGGTVLLCWLQSSIQYNIVPTSLYHAARSTHTDVSLVARRDTILHATGYARVQQRDRRYSALLANNTRAFFPFDFFCFATIYHYYCRQPSLPSPATCRRRNSAHPNLLPLLL